MTISRTVTIIMSVFCKDIHSWWFNRTNTAPQDPVFSANILDNMRFLDWENYLGVHENISNLCWHVQCVTFHLVNGDATEHIRQMIIFLSYNVGLYQQYQSQKHFGFAVANFFVDATQTFPHHKAEAKWKGEKREQADPPLPLSFTTNHCVKELTVH